MTPKKKIKEEISDIQIIDGFLDKDEFIELKDLFVHENTTWQMTHGISSNDSTNAVRNPLDNYMFNHMIYNQMHIMSNSFERVRDILETRMRDMLGQQIRVITRIKINLYTRTEKVQLHPWHRDSNDVEGLKGCLLSFNTCDGFTGFSDGTQVDSVENRAIIFDATKRHHSTSCSNAPYRMNMNVNYV